MAAAVAATIATAALRMPAASQHQHLCILQHPCWAHTAAELAAAIDASAAVASECGTQKQKDDKRKKTAAGKQRCNRVRLQCVSIAGRS